VGDGVQDEEGGGEELSSTFGSGIWVSICICAPGEIVSLNEETPEMQETTWTYAPKGIKSRTWVAPSTSRLP
jgi:hypothetical protein